MRGRKRPRNAQPRNLAPGPRTWGAVLLVTALALYLNTLGHGFVFDDGTLILQNPQVTEFRVGEMFGAAGYRPVRTFTYALNYAVGGEDPFGYHLFNVLLHALAVLLLFGLMTRCGLSAAAAAAGAAVFACHPAQTAAVAYISGRKDLLATAFLLGGMILFARFRKQGGWKPAAASMALFALAVFSKEVAVVFPLLLLAAEFLVFRDEADSAERLRPAAALRKHPWAWASALVVAGTGTYYILAVSKATRMIGFWGGDPAANYGTSLKLFAHYLQLTLWPHPLIADYKGQVFPLSPGFSDLATLLGGFLLTAFVAAAFWAASRLPRLAFGMFWYLAALLPVLQIIPFHEIAADHFLYLPLAGAAWIVAEAMERLTAGSFRRPAWAFLGAVLLVFSVRTVQRNADWSDSRSLWEATLAAAPGSYRANANLGNLYYSEPRLRTRALELTRRAIELAPEDPAAISNLGAMTYIAAQGATARGDLDTALRQANEAVQWLERALEKNRRDGSVLSNLGNCHKLLGAIRERLGDAGRAQAHRLKAAEFFRAAVTRDRRDQVKAAWFNYALLQMDMSDYSGAADSLGEYLKFRPEDSRANFEMGWCQIQLGRPAQAVPFLETAASSTTDPATAGKAARMLADMGR